MAVWVVNPGRKIMKKTKIQITMLGKFEITVNGEQVLPQLAQSRKVLLLVQYLLLAHNRRVPHKELTDALWAGESSSNPDMALRAILHRFRNMVEEEGPQVLESCILTNRGSYQWSNTLNCEVDVYTMQTLLEHIRYEQNEDNQIQLYEKILSLYGGRLLPMSAGERWVESLSLELHTQYQRVTAALLDIYKKREDYEEIVRVCRGALAIDMYSERLHQELAMAYAKLGREDVAQEVAAQAQKLGYRAINTAGPREVNSAYHMLIQAERFIENDIEDIYQSIWGDDTENGAMVSDFLTFKALCHLQLRELERYGTPFFFALISITSGEPEQNPADTAQVMDTLEKVLVYVLRRSDAVTRYNATQYLLLLTGTSTDAGANPLERVKTEFYRRVPDTPYLLSYRMRAPQLDVNAGQPARPKPADVPPVKRKVGRPPKKDKAAARRGRSR